MSSFLGRVRELALSSYFCSLQDLQRLLEQVSYRKIQISLIITPQLAKVLVACKTLRVLSRPHVPPLSDVVRQILDEENGKRSRPIQFE